LRSTVGGQPFESLKALSKVEGRSAVSGQQEVPTRSYQLLYTKEGSHKPICGNTYSRNMAKIWIAI